MIEGMGLHRSNDAQIIRDSRRMRQHLGQLCSGLTVPCELVLGSQQSGIRINKCSSISVQQIGRWKSAVQFFQRRLVVQHLELTGPAPHEQQNDVFRAAGIMRLSDGQGIRILCVGPDAFSQQSRQCHLPHAKSTLLQKPAPFGQRG